MNIRSILTCFFVLMIAASSCKKENPTINYIPTFLTDKVWIFDTLLINPPATYNSLSDTAKYTYNVSKAWLKNARIGFNKDGSVVMDGDYDFGYKQWKLINNNADLEMTLTSGKDTLYNWKANTLGLTYIKPVEKLFNATFKYK